jgi:uncharacterized membrane protein YkoI
MAMPSTRRFVFAALAMLALTPALAEESGRPAHEAAAPVHACLNQKERRAEEETGRLVRLGTAMHVARARMPGTVVRARLCRSNDALVYVLTVLARDGKVAQLTVDAVKGTLVGGL